VYFGDLATPTGPRSAIAEPEGLGARRQVGEWLLGLPRLLAGRSRRAPRGWHDDAGAGIVAIRGSAPPPAARPNQSCRFLPASRPRRRGEGAIATAGRERPSARQAASPRRCTRSAAATPLGPRSAIAVPESLVRGGKLVDGSAGAGNGSMRPKFFL
jgi:hypothetical protein